MATNAVHTDESGHLHLLLEHLVFAVEWVCILQPAHRLVWHADAAEHLLVEIMLADQEFIHILEEKATLGTLDDAVVIGARHRHHLGDTESREHLLVASLELSRVVDGTDTHDHALPWHQSGHRLHGANGARIGEADIGPLEILHRQLVGAHLANDLVVGHHEPEEVVCVGVAQDGNHERALTAAFVDIHRQTDVDV